MTHSQVGQWPCCVFNPCVIIDLSCIRAESDQLNGALQVGVDAPFVKLQTVLNDCPQHRQNTAHIVPHTQI